ncbi:hypothetical protein LMG29542_08112 [Paraburkholderia humisilvae]|uniref:Uncharacterized protein n=1 Tax=Paraburkholderia humisilvae TaxID=627669 RepID=A0A6J5F8A0_9BURK|nr:hypothetical protein LMG29542_08112 [Paraburkholderia humisilvae]
MQAAAADGQPNSAIAQRLQLTRATVGKWRLRFLEQRVNGLHDEARPGKPRTIDDERVAQLIHKTLHTKPADGATHWSVRTIAAETEPPRIWWRLQLLREWSHEQVEQIFC